MESTSGTSPPILKVGDLVLLMPHYDEYYIVLGYITTGPAGKVWGCTLVASPNGAGFAYYEFLESWLRKV